MTVQFAPTAAAVQFSVVPVLVVDDAASPVGALGAAAQTAPVTLLLPPQAGSSTRPAIVSARKPIQYRLRESENDPINPTKDKPMIGSHIAYLNFLAGNRAPLELGTVMVSVVVAPPAVGVTGLVEKLEAAQVGNGDPPPVTVQVRFTGDA